MKTNHFLSLFAALATASSLPAATTLVTDANLADYTGASSISIPAGDTLQFSGITSAYTLSAPISGGGTLLITDSAKAATLAGDNSEFTGTLLVTNANVTVGHAHALGSATVSVLTDDSAVREFIFAATGDYPNNMTIDQKSIKTGTSAFRYSVATGHTVTNSGTVTFVLNGNSSTPRIEIGTSNADGGQSGRLVFTGMLNKNGYMYLYGSITLAKTLTSTTGLGTGGNFFLNSNCDAILEKDVSSMFSTALQCAKGTLRFAAEDCLTSVALYVGTSSSPDQTVQLDGHGQHFLTVRSISGTDSNLSKTANKVYTSSAPATMTVTHNISNGINSDQGWGRFCGHLSFAYDSDGASGAYCGLNTYGTGDNDTDGSITALNGTIHLGDNMRFTALSSLVVTNTGSIALATGSFPETCDVYLSGTGKLILSNDVSLAVNRVFYKVGEAFVQANVGDYTKGEEGVAAYLDGAGTLTALTSPPVTEHDYHWASTGDTSLTPAANWEENQSPDFANGAAYLHFNAGTPAAEAAGDITVYGLDFTRGTDFAFGGAGNTVSVGLGGVTVANTDGEAAHAVTIAPRLNLVEFEETWTVGGNSALVLSGGLSSAVDGSMLTISGGETAASGNSVTFTGDSSQSAMAVAVSNVARVVVASDTALPAQGLVMYDKLPDISSISSNGAPLEIRDIAHTFSSESEVFWSNGVFRQTGPLILRSRSSASGHRAQINITGGEVQLLGGLECDGARQGFWLYGDAKLRLAGTLKDCGQDIDFRGRSGKMNEIRSTAKTTSAMRAMYIGRVTFICEAENVLPYGNGSGGSPSVSLGIQSDYGLEEVYAKVDLNGYDQQVNCMAVPSYASMDLIAGAHAVITSAVPATLTLKRGSGNAQINKFSGAVSLSLDCGASSGKTFTLTNVVSDTTGDLLVKSGTLVFAYGAGWGGSSNVTVAAGATLRVTDSGAATAFARADGGPSIVDLKLNSEDGTYGKLDLGGNVSVHTFRIGDTFLPAGDYGSTESGAANANDNHFTGTGVLHVRRSGLFSGLRMVIR